MARKTYTLTPEQYDRLLDAMKPVPYIAVGGYPPRSQQENANDAWKSLGRELGFDGMSARPLAGGTKYQFTAEPIDIPNDTTVAAMEEFRAGDVTSYDSVETLFQDLNDG